MTGPEKRYFEDLTVGERTECGSIDVTEEEMLEFAERYDPQPFHVDREAAEASMFGDLIASGWLTCALTMRLLVTGFMNETHIFGGRGMDDLRWHQPVYAGDVLSVEAELVKKHPGDNPVFGHTKSEITTTNQHDVEVLTMTGLVVIEKRDT